MKRVYFLTSLLVYLMCIFMISACTADRNPNDGANDLWNIAKKKIISDDKQETLFPKVMEISDKSIPNFIVVVHIPKINVWVIKKYDGNKLVVVPHAYAMQPEAQPLIKSVVYLMEGGKRKEILTFESKCTAVIFESDGTRRLVLE